MSAEELALYAFTALISTWVGLVLYWLWEKRGLRRQRRITAKTVRVMELMTAENSDSVAAQLQAVDALVEHDRAARAERALDHLVRVLESDSAPTQAPGDRAL